MIFLDTLQLEISSTTYELYQMMPIWPYFVIDKVHNINMSST